MGVNTFACKHNFVYETTLMEGQKSIFFFQKAM